MKRWIGLGLLALVVTLGVVSSDALSLTRVADHYGALKEAVASDWLGAMVLFFGLYASVVALSLPIATVLTLMGAALFGWWGLIPIWLGATVGAAVVFLVVRYFLEAWAKQRLSRVLTGMRAAFLANPLRWALTMRLLPVIPFWMANAIPAVLGMSLPAFVLSTGLGILPGTLVYVGLGVGFDRILSEGGVPDLSVLSSPAVFGPLIALGLLSLVTTWVARRQRAEGSGDGTH